MDLPNSQKLVSIGFLTRNRAGIIPRAIDSLLAQTHKNFELIISDNASTDETERICREYAERDQRIRYIRQKENLGLLGNFDFVAREARGDFFMWAADDDWRDPRFIEMLLKALEAHPNHGVAACSFKAFYEDGLPATEVRFVDDLDLTDYSYYKIYSGILLGNVIGVGGTYLYGLMRIELLRKLIWRGFPRCLGQDRIFSAEMALSAHFVSVPEVLFFRTAGKESIKVRHADDDVGELCLRPARCMHMIGMMFWWFLTSRAIPFYRKPLFLVPWLGVIWKKRGRIRYELTNAIGLRSKKSKTS